MRNLILVLIIFLTFLMILKKDLSLKFVKNSFDKKISKIQIDNLKNLSASIILNSIYLKEGDHFWEFNPKRLKKDFEKINEIKNYNFSLKKMVFFTYQLLKKNPIWFGHFLIKKNLSTIKAIF